MKTLFLAAVLLSLTSVSQAAPSHFHNLYSPNVQSAMSYTCYRYVDGKPTGGFLKISADSKSEAEAKALAWYQKEGMKVDYVVCE